MWRSTSAPIRTCTVFELGKAAGGPKGVPQKDYKKQIAEASRSGKISLKELFGDMSELAASPNITFALQCADGPTADVTWNYPFNNLPETSAESGDGAVKYVLRAHFAN